MKLGLDARAEPALAGDQLVSRAHRPDEHGLKHAVLAERVGQTGDLARAEVPAGLEWIGVDLVDGDMDQLGLFERAGFEPTVIADPGVLRVHVRDVAYSRSMTSMTSSV